MSVRTGSDLTVERGHDAEKKYESTITVLSKPSDDREYSGQAVDVN